MAGTFKVRLLSRTSQVTVDLAVLSAAFWLAFLLRFDGRLPAEHGVPALLLWPYVVGLQYACLHVADVPRFAWRYVGLREVERIAGALGASTAFLVALRFASVAFAETHPAAVALIVPLGVTAIDAALAFLGVTGVRVTWRLLHEQHRAQGRSPTNVTRRVVVLIGAGEAGLSVAKELAARPDLGLRAVAFVDDNAGTWGTLLNGLPVVAGGLDGLEALKERERVDEALITMPEASGDVLRRVLAACTACGLPVKVIPGLQDLIGGRGANLSRIREVSIEDLLRREPVRIDVRAVAGLVDRRPVLVTGAGGSIGSELCRQLCAFGAASVLMLDRAEGALFTAHAELARQFPEQVLVPIVGDVTCAPRMEAVLRRHRPALVLHAAAHKHVPLMETAPGEAVRNNVLGTRVLADAAEAHEVEAFVLVSSDKAVEPCSAMGASKRACELYVQALAATRSERRRATRFVVVRFGNVLGSSGSVVPTFQEQLRRGGPVTVTHPDMERFFMTPDEACQLILQTASMGGGGEVFVLDMGAPLRLVDLARDMIRLSGLRPDVDVPLVFTGVRPGERLSEALFSADETPEPTAHAKVLVARGHAVRPLDEVVAAIDDLAALCDDDDDAQVRRALLELVAAPQAAARSGSVER